MAQQYTLRAEINQVKRENADLYRQLLKNTAEAHKGKDAGWLESQTRLCKNKVEQELELAKQIQSELDSIKGQLKQQVGGDQQQRQVSTMASNKQMVVLQERFSHHRRKLDAVVASNTTRQQSIDNLSKRKQTAHAAAQHLSKQLASMQEELADVQALISATEATQHKAEGLADLLKSQDDEEHLALGAVAQQIAQLRLVVQQQQQQERQQQQSLVHAWPNPLHEQLLEEDDQDSGQHPCGCSEEAAQEVLSQLCCMLQAAGYDPPAAAPLDASAPSSDRHAWVCQQLAQLKDDNFRLFQQCSLANWLQQWRRQGAN